MKGQKASSPWGPWRPPVFEAQPLVSEAKVENFKSALGWQLAHACGCMWLWQMILDAFIGRMHFFCIFLINLINLSSVAMATELNLPFPGPWTKGQNLLLGAVLGWNQQPKAHTLGRTQLWGQANWQSGMLAAQRRKFP